MWGKSPQVVFSDVDDLDALAGAIVDGITFNSGQVCVAGSRLLVERSLHDVLVDKVVARAAVIRGGDPLDESTTLGPLASADQPARVCRYVESGSAEGATLALHGATPPALDAGCYCLPTVFTGVRANMRIAREEIFAPVLATQPFDGEDDAVALANGTIYGLVATVWTRDLPRRCGWHDASARAGSRWLRAPAPAPAGSMRRPAHSSHTASRASASRAGSRACAAAAG